MTITGEAPNQVIDFTYPVNTLTIGTVNVSAQQVAANAFGGIRADAQVGLAELAFEVTLLAPDHLAANMAAVMDVIIRQKPASAKGVYIRSVTVSSTMGPGVALDPNMFRRTAAS